jgi:hypothetical protein
MAVADEDALAVNYLIVSAGVVGESGVIFVTAGEGVGQLTGGVNQTEENVSDGVAAFLPREKGFDDGGDVVNPGHRYRRAVIQDDDGFRIGFSDLGDNLVLLWRQVHILSIETFALLLLV